MSDLIPPHGGYRDLAAYQMAEIVFDCTVAFCHRFVDPKSRTTDQMIQAARSGKQNIVEGSMGSGTSKKFELKLIGVARASLEELLTDYRDYLRINELPEWEKNHEKSIYIRNLYKRGRLYATYKMYIEEKTGETAANTCICLIHQTNYLLDRLLKQLSESFLDNGGFTERLYQERKRRKS